MKFFGRGFVWILVYFSGFIKVLVMALPKQTCKKVGSSVEVHLQDASWITSGSCGCVGGECSPAVHSSIPA